MSEPKISAGPPQPQGIGEDPLLHFTKVFVKFLQVVFSTFEKGDYQWLPDPEITDVVISDQNVLSSAVVEKRPAIAVVRGAAQWLNVSMDQFKEVDFETGKKTHTDLVAAQMTYLCVAREGLEAQRLAWISGYATRTLKKNLLRVPGMHKVGDTLSYGEEQDAGNAAPEVKGYRLVPVSVPFFFQDTYGITPVDNLLLKELDLRLTSQAVIPQPEQPQLRPPAFGGRVLRTEQKIFSLTQRVTPLGAVTPKNRK